MKYTVLSLLLATILVMGIATIFTACPEPEDTSTAKEEEQAGGYAGGEEGSADGGDSTTTTDGGKTIGGGDKETKKAGKQWHVSTLDTDESLENPFAIAAKDASTLYVAETSKHIIREIAIASVTGTVTTIADEDDVKNPYGIAFAKGALYVADTQNNRIKKIDLSDNTVSTIAGGRKQPAVGSEPSISSLDRTIAGTNAWFLSPRGIAATKDGNTLYVADTSNHRIRKIALSVSGDSGDFKVSPIAGSTQGKADTNTEKDIVAQFDNPLGIAPDADGSALYVTEPAQGRIRRIDLSADNSVTTIVHGLKSPTGIALDPTDDKVLYVVEAGAHVIKKITLNDDYTYKSHKAIAGGLGETGTADGKGTTARFDYPRGIVAAKDKDGSTVLYVTDQSNNNIRKLEYKE